MMRQAGLLYETLSGRARGLDGKLPPLLAVVVYTGVSRWREPEDLAVLVRASEGAMVELNGRRYRREGIEQGIACERALLCRLAAHRFGDDLGQRLGARLADVKDPILFDKVGDLILECATGEELLSGVNGMAAADR